MDNRTMRCVWVAVLFLGALGGCRCGVPVSSGTDAAVVDAGQPCTLDSECPFNEACVNLHCARLSQLDSGGGCFEDADCPPGLVCLPSTSTCVVPTNPDAGPEVDAGPGGNCLPGESQSCGVSKFGACRLGTLVCGLGDAGWGFGPCTGAIDPIPEGCNGLDDDCDGLVDDGLGDTTCGTGECARTVATCLGGQSVTCTPGPASAEVCDGKDNDCNAATDEGLGDLSCGVGECARTVPACANAMLGSCLPGDAGTELCNGKDDDCDGTVDDGLGSASCGLGICARSAPTCVAGAPNPCVPGDAGTEVCNTLDDNCNGTTDEGCACTNGQTQPCYSGPPATQGVGICRAGLQTCATGAWGSCTGQVTPAATEACNSLDDNCNTQTDEGLGNSSCGVGACARTVANCVGGATITCLPGDAGTETCNNVDDNCNGQTDEGLGNISCGVGACLVSVAACVGGTANTCTPGTAGPEVCNNLDDNCNGSTDETFPQSGQPCSTGLPGLCATGAYVCPSGALVCNQTVNPVPEVCGNGLDENCNGINDDPLACGCNSAIDNDLDGANQCVDCNDNDGTIRPGAMEKCNGKDDNCNSQRDEGFDVDGDGFTTCGTMPAGGLDPLRVDCNDGNAFVFPLKVADCGNAGTPNTANGVDDNCNGYTDETCSCTAMDKDNDGVTTCAGDCNDNDGAVAPGRVEVCDGRDNDCNVATVDNCGVSDPCGSKQGPNWNLFPPGTDRCRPDLICASNLATGALTCGSFCNQTSGQGLNDSCAATEACFLNLVDSDGLHLCTVLPLGVSTTGQTCTLSSQCRTADCRLDGAVRYCSDKCTHEAGCSANTTCQLQQNPITSGPFLIGYYNFGYCRADSQITGVKTTGQACTNGSSECRTGVLGCLNGACVEPCCRHSDCTSAVCSVNGPRTATGYTSGGSSILSIVPVCLAGGPTRVAGQACTSSAQCKSGICDNNLNICIDVCCNDGSCANGTTCEPVQLKLSTGEVTFARLCVFSPVPAQIVQK